MPETLSFQDAILETIQNIGSGAYKFICRPVVMLIELSDDRFKFWYAYHRHS